MSRTKVATIVNGEPVEFLAGGGQSLLDALRDELRLTGTKEGCGTGDCGACSVVVDGRLVCRDGLPITAGLVMGVPFPVLLRRAQLRLTARAAWGINGGTRRAAVAAFQALGGASFVVDGASPDRHSALLDAGVELSFNERHSAGLTLRGEFSQNVSSFGAKARYTLKW